MPTSLFLAYVHVLSQTLHEISLDPVLVIVETQVVLYEMSAGGSGAQVRLNY